MLNIQGPAGNGKDPFYIQIKANCQTTILDLNNLDFPVLVQGK